MSKTLLVLRNEIVNTVMRPSFLITAFALPLLGFLVFAAVGGIGEDSGGTPGGSTDPANSFEFKVEGYVDPGGLIQTIPADVPPDILLAYPDEESARKALEAGEITAYYVVPPDYVERGEIVYVHPEANPISSGGQTWLIRWVMSVNLLGGDTERASLVWNPMDIQVNTPQNIPQRDENNPATFYVPYAITMIFYFVMMMGSSMLLQSMNTERKNRVMEILIQSISPQQMLSGKIFGLGIVGLVQTVVWFGTTYTLLRLGGRSLDLPPGLEIPFSVVLWGILFFLLGYAVYASLMAGLGALVPNLRDAGQVTFAIMLPIILPLFFVGVLIEAPHEMLSVVLSIFPLTAPVAMMTRLATGGVPLWQPLLAAGLLSITAVLIVRAVARMFQAQVLLSGQSFNLKRYFEVLLGRA